MLYLDTSVLPARLTGAAIRRPVLADPLLRHGIHLLHAALGAPGEEFEAESRLALVQERLRGQLRPGGSLAPPAAPAAGGGRAARRLAVQLRELLDARTVAGLSLKEAAALLHAHPTHVIRCFTGAYGLPPHAYLTGRRIDRARRLLLDGCRAADVAAAAGRPVRSSAPPWPGR